MGRLSSGFGSGTAFAKAWIEVPPMRRPAGFAITLLLVTAVTGCATMSVSSHVERGLDFAQYRTYNWGTPDELPTGDPRLDRDPFFKDQVQGEVEKAMAGRGLESS